MINELTKVLSLNNKIDIENILKEDMIRNGINPEDVPLMSTTSLMEMLFNTFFDYTLSTVNNISRESDLLRARQKSTLMNQLAQHISEISLSKPSMIDLYIHIPVEDVKRLGKLIQKDTYEYTYKDENTVVIDGLTFMPTHSDIYVRVTFPEDGSPIKYRVFRRASDTEIVNYTTQKMTIDGLVKVIFKEKFKQVVIEKLEKVFTDDQLDKFICMTKNPVHDFRLMYRENRGENTSREIQKRLYFTRGIGEYLEYSMLSNSSFSVDYSYVKGGFKPEINGVLEIIIETTTGKDVKFRGEAKVGVCVPTTMRVTYDTNEDYFESKGGRLASDNIEELRAYIIKCKGSRRRIDTEDDMSTFLLNYDGSSIFKPKLIINDIMRLFSLYVGLSFNTELNGKKRRYTVPTTSGDIIVAPGTLPVRNYNGKNYRLFSEPKSISSVQNQYNSYYYLGAHPTPPGADTPSEISSYQYMFPFIGFYDEEDNFFRTYLAEQYGIRYDSMCSFDTDDDVPSRFINNTFRIEDTIDKDTGLREYKIITKIRADNDAFKLDDTTFEARMIFSVVGSSAKFYIIGKIVDLDDNNKYDLVFDLNTTREIFDDKIELSVTTAAGTVLTNVTAVKQKLSLQMFVKNGATLTHVSTFDSDVELFKEVTGALLVQTEVDYIGNLNLILAPMIEKEFYSLHENRMRFIEELTKIFDFLDSNVYGELDMFSPTGYSLRDLQETLFTVSVKFAKTHGFSKFLELKGVGAGIPIKNLQIAPKLNIRKKEQEFDETIISDYVNNKLMTHDFFNEDLHMNEVVKTILTDSSDYVYMLDFTNIDDYRADYILLSHNDAVNNNSDVPEIISIRPIYDPATNVYNYEVKYNNI